MIHPQLKLGVRPRPYCPRMSYSNHRRLALDPKVPMAQRMSHARSCAVHVSKKHRVQRSVIIAEVQQICGVDLTAAQAPDGIERAIAALDEVRSAGVKAPPAV